MQEGWLTWSAAARGVSMGGDGGIVDKARDSRGGGRDVATEG